MSNNDSSWADGDETPTCTRSTKRGETCRRFSRATEMAIGYIRMSACAHAAGKQ